jgi:hypothetical protein
VLRLPGAAWGLPDEYQEGAGPFCGHSLMNGPGNSRIFCSPSNHCYDPAGGSPPPGFNCSSSGAMWNLVQQSGKVPAGVGPSDQQVADVSGWWLPDNETATLPGNGTVPMVTVEKINAPY